MVQLVLPLTPWISGGKYFTALQAAACMDRDAVPEGDGVPLDIVRLLLDHGADPNIQGQHNSILTSCDQVVTNGMNPRR
jgi:hypothetical protein